jgi:hypothetical protein
MATGSRDEPDALSAADRERLAAYRAATSLADLVPLTGAASEHEAYFDAKREWRGLRARELASERSADPDAERAAQPGRDPDSERGRDPDRQPSGDPGRERGDEPQREPGGGPEREPGGVPGARVDVDGTAFHVHGVTHADTPAERRFLREHVRTFLEEGAAVYSEQGLRSMYFDDLGAVCGMDDYSWAMERCEELGLDSHVDDLEVAPFDGLAENVDSLAARFQDAVFTLVDSGRDLYGERFAAALGDVATAFLTSHEDAAIGDDFESFRLTSAAARDPSRLADLQRYYETAFLPQPLEREWLQRHDPELELMTHARNERMADYAVFHHETADAVHLIVGAAHQPGVRYYLERHRDGDRSLDEFDLVG